eukprot:4582558-Lingulodinium_polyedra.AAC.1
MRRGLTPCGGCTGSGGCNNSASLSAGAGAASGPPATSLRRGTQSTLRQGATAQSGKRLATS